MNANFQQSQPPGPGALLKALSGAAPVLQSVHADATVTGLLFELTFEQRYVNESEENIEAVYSFPLPWNAVLLGMEFVLGDKVLSGKVVAKADAEERYEAELEAGNTAIMLERAADGLYTVNLGNLLAREHATVRIRYAQLLSFEQGQVRISVPTTIAPRFGSPAAAGLRLHQVPEHSMQVDYPFAMKVSFAGAVSTGRMSSPTHALSVCQAGGKLQVSLGMSARLDRDFVLLVDGLEGQSLAAVGKDGDGEVALASFCPAPDTPDSTAPLSIKILVDCSGSMNGDSIGSARKALHEVLKHLKRSDRFSYSRFGSEVAHCTPSLVAATLRAVREGAQWIASTRADMGGTEMREALLSTFALDQPFDADILLVTDGEVWEVDRLVASAETAGQRIFAVGIGAAPASSLLHALASKTGGACEFVGVNDDVEAAILRMFRRMRQSSVRNVAVGWDRAPTWQSKTGKAIFCNETVHSFARFDRAHPAMATLSWQVGEDGVPQEWPLAFEPSFIEGDTLARVAAASRLSGGNKKEQLSLALDYQLVTENTNLLIVHEREESIKAFSQPVLKTVPQMTATGWSGVGIAARSSPVAFSLGPPALWRRAEAVETVQSVDSPGQSYDIPSFLRKEAPRVDVFRYRDQLKAFLHLYSLQDEEADAAVAFPTSFAEIDGKLPDDLILELELLVDAGFPEHEVIHAFLVNLASCFTTVGVASRLLRRIGRLGLWGGDRSELNQRVERIARDAYEARHVAFDRAAFLLKQAD